MSKKKGKSRRSKASKDKRGKETDVQPEEPQGAQDSEVHPEPDDRGTNSPDIVEEKREEAPSRSRQPSYDPVETRHQSKHRRWVRVVDLRGDKADTVH